MAGAAGWLLGRRGLRIALTAILFPLPLLALVSAAIVASTAITSGWRTAAEDSVAAAVLLMIMTAFAGGYWMEIGAGAGATWLVALLLGQLRRIGSLDLAVQSAVLTGFLGALAFTLWSADPHAYWEEVLLELADRAQSAGLELGPSELLPMAAQLMTGAMSASAVASALGALFLGRWWAGEMDGGSFGAEFRELRMGRVLGLVAALVGAVALTSLKPSVDDLLLVLGVGFVVQGLAVVHWHGNQHSWPKIWPLAIYLPLALVPAVGVLELLALSLVGLVDNGFRLRRTGGKLV